ncbi:MAG: VOC family protein [Actinomycetota bacterium]|nr:VOC family protein [Actinomycetota bacterium]
MIADADVLDRADRPRPRRLGQLGSSPQRDRCLERTADACRPRSVPGVGNPVVHFEILGPDGPALIEFYRQLFGWRLHDGQLPGWPHYGLLRPSGTGIGGAVGTADATDHPVVVVYVEVDDPQAYLERAQELGATVVMSTTHIAEAEITVAWLQDPQGNVVGVVKNHEAPE